MNFNYQKIIKLLLIKTINTAKMCSVFVQVNRGSIINRSRTENFRFWSGTKYLNRALIYSINILVITFYCILLELLRIKNFPFYLQIMLTWALKSIVAKFNNVLIFYRMIYLNYAREWSLSGQICLFDRLNVV